MNMTLRLAEAVVHAAMAHAEAIGIRVCVAVCDSNGRIFAFLKMDSTGAMSGHEAMRRAMAAAGAGVPSQLAGEGRNTASSASMEGIGLSAQIGGLPLLSDKHCFGGIGVCGGSCEQEVACAYAGIAAIPFRAVALA